MSPGRAAGLLLCALGGLSLATSSAGAQRPTVSRRLAPALARDPAHPVWLFARPTASLDDVVALVRETGGTVRRVSRWLHAVSAVLGPETLAAARARRDLRLLQPVARFGPRGPEPTPPPSPVPFPFDVAPALGAADSGYGPSQMPFRRLNLLPLARQGVRGAGVRIALLDSGFETELPIFAQATIAAQYDFVFNDSVVRNQPGDVTNASQHGTSVWSLLAGRAPDTLVGVAPDAAYLLAKTEDIRSETPVEEDNFVAALEWADSVGVDIVSSSLGYLRFDGGGGYTAADLNGDIAVTTVAADLAAQRGILVVVSAGNDGPGASTLNSPADGDSVLAVGAEDSLGTVASFSSRGPTADGRIKPDFIAPGVNVWLAQPLAGGTVFGRSNGTSFAAPLIAGTAALVRSLHPTLDPMALAEALRRTADARDAPTNRRGAGRPDGHAAGVFARGVSVVEPGAALASVTPRFVWTAPEVPGFALPVTYHLVVTRGNAVLLDETTTDTITRLTLPQHAGTVLAWRLSASSADSAAFVAPPDSTPPIPAWVTLDTFDDPNGLTIQELRPEFRWTAPSVVSPPGPFLFDVAITRVDTREVDIEAKDLTEPRFVPPVDLERNTPYRWSVTARLGAEQEIAESRGTFVVADGSAPVVTQLFQNFPNPFPNTATGLKSTCFWFDLSVEGVATLSILDLRGHLVRKLVPAPSQPLFFRAGRYGRPASGAGRCDPDYEWDGSTAAGAMVPPGVYLVRLDTPAGTFFKRVVFLGAN